MRFKKTLLLLAFFVLMPAWAQVIKVEKDFIKFLDQKEAEYEKICVINGTETWNLYSGEAKPDLVTPKKMYKELYDQKQLQDNIEYWSKNLSDSKDNILKRRVEIWNDILTAAKVELDPEIATMAAKLLEDINTRERNDKDAEAALAKRVIELMKLRNQKVKTFGYNNYAEFNLDFAGIGYKWFDKFVSDIEERTGKVYDELVANIKKEKEKVSIRDLFKYFNMGYQPKLSEDSIYLVMKETLAGIGVDYEKLPIRFVIKPADFGGNCIGVTIPEDFRVVMVPNMPISVYLHELGHGYQWMRTSINHPILEGYEWCLGNGGAPFFEGMAQTMAFFSSNKQWYKKFTKLSDEEIAKVTAFDKYSEALTIRYTTFNFLVEIELYRNLDKDPVEVYNNLYKRFFKLDEPPFRKLNLVSTFYVDYPCYLQNYLMADIIGWQVHQTLQKKFGDQYIFDKNVAQFLTDNLYKDGMLKDWKQILKDATGTEVDYDGFLKSRGI